MKKNLTAAILTIIIVLVIFNEVVIDFLSQFKTTSTLLMYSNFWNEKIHDWLGDAITLVGVMLAFSIPFVAQVVQWVVGTYGVTNFPEITKNRLKIHSLLIKMFLFVGFVIFWRIFIFDISPHTKSLYVFFNIGISILFLWILWRLFIVVNFIIKCTFDFRKFIIAPAYEYIKNIEVSIPDPFDPIKDFLAPPRVSIEYLQCIELLRDNEVSNFKRGNILMNEDGEFEQFVWKYIQAILLTNNRGRIEEAIILQMKLSSSVRKMCSLFGEEYYARYVTLASQLAYHTVQNRYYVLDFYFTESQEKGNNSQHNLYQEELKKSEKFSKYYADILFLAEEIEGKNNHDYYPVLSCQYLLNHSSLSYYKFFSIEEFDQINFIENFYQINQWEEDIITISKRLIVIAGRYRKSSALLAVYNNIRNDLQFLSNQEIFIYPYLKHNHEHSDEGCKIVREFLKIENEKELEECFKFFLSNQFNQYFEINYKERHELLQRFLKIRYKFKIDKLLLFWLGYLSFDTSIIIKILEEASPIDPSRIIDVGTHFVPSNLSDAFKQYLIVYNDEFELRSRFGNSEEYQIIFSTIVLYFLLKKLKNNSKSIDTFQEAKQIYDDKEISIRNIKSIADIATLWKSSPKGLESNQGIIDLCLNYGVNFKELKEYYNSFLTNLIEVSGEAIKRKVLNAPIDETLIQSFYQKLNEKSKKIFDRHQFEIVPDSNLNKKNKYRFMNIDREWFIDAETGVHYVRDSLLNEFYHRCDFFLKSNIGNTMYIVNGGDTPEVTFSYKEVGNKLYFYCEYNFCF